MASNDEFDKVKEMAASVMQNLHKNGFPGRSVAFPLERLYDAAYARGISFNKVRDELKQQGVASELETQRIIFSPYDAQKETTFPNFGDLGAAMDAVKQNPDLLNHLQRAMENLTPEQMAQMAENIPGMDRESAKQHMDQLARMSPEERNRLLDIFRSGS